MLNTLKCLLVLFVMSASAWAQNTSPALDAANQDQASKESLRVLLAGFSSMQADFNQTVSDVNGEVLQQAQGKVSLAKPNKLAWNVTMPEESALIADGTTIYSVDPFVEQVTLLEQQQLTQSNPLMLLVSNDPKEWEQVSVSVDKNEYIVRSTQENATITEIRLMFNKQGILEQLISKDSQQQQNLVKFNDVVYNQKIPSSTFTFVASEDWIIDDQRNLQSN